MLAPPSIKEAMSLLISKTYEREDIVQSIIAAFIEAYRTWKPNKGSDLINWLSWRVPYLTSKYFNPYACAKSEHLISEKYVKDLEIFESLPIS